MKTESKLETFEDIGVDGVDDMFRYFVSKVCEDEKHRDE